MKTFKFFLTCFILFSGFTAQSQNNLYAPNPANLASPNGNVGVDAPSPASEFQVKRGIDRTAMGTAYPAGIVYNYSGYLGLNLTRKNSTGNWTAETDGNNNGATGLIGTTKGDLHFVTLPTTGATTGSFNDAQIKAATKMFIGSRDGLVGIHTMSPLHPLHVNGNVLIDGAYASLLFGPDQTGAPSWGEWGVEYYDATPDISQYGLNFWKPWGSQNSSGGNGNDNWFLFLNNDGKIGMGVHPSQLANTPYRLSVCGSIRAKEIRVNTGWCDFVFENNYELLPLVEVETFINTNKHLPEIPAGKEIESDGVDLGNMVSRQMQKIEELYLYVIELNKKVDRLECENSELKEKQK